MKVFALAFLLCAVVSVHAGDKEMMMLKKWAMHKACESCFGEENTKKFMIKMKTAHAKCSGMEAPELELPIFQNPHRVAGALVHGAFHGDHKHQGDWMDKAMKRFFMKKMFKSFMHEQFEMDDDDDMAGMDDLEIESPMRFFKQSRRNSQFRRRHQRDTTAAMMDLGEKLTEKLEMAEMKMVNKIGNMTCMLQECGLLTKDKKIAPVKDIISHFNEEFEIKDEWLHDQIESDITKCHMFATSIPEEFFADCHYPEYIGRVKMFKMCKKMAKLRTCMNYDIRTKFEKNFVPIGDMAEDTGLPENALYPLIMKMLHGPEMDM